MKDRAFMAFIFLLVMSRNVNFNVAFPIWDDIKSQLQASHYFRINKPHHYRPRPYVLMLPENADEYNYIDGEIFPIQGLDRNQAAVNSEYQKPRAWEDNIAKKETERPAEKTELELNSESARQFVGDIQALLKKYGVDKISHKQGTEKTNSSLVFPIHVEAHINNINIGNISNIFEAPPSNKSYIPPDQSSISTESTKSSITCNTSMTSTTTKRLDQDIETTTKQYINVVHKKHEEDYELPSYNSARRSMGEELGENNLSEYGATIPSKATIPAKIPPSIISDNYTETTLPLAIEANEEMAQVQEPDEANFSKEYMVTALPSKQVNNFDDNKMQIQASTEEHKASGKFDDYKVLGNNLEKENIQVRVPAEVNTASRTSDDHMTTVRAEVTARFPAEKKINIAENVVSNVTNDYTEPTIRAEITSNGFGDEYVVMKTPIKLNTTHDIHSDYLGTTIPANVTVNRPEQNIDMHVPKESHPISNIPVDYIGTTMPAEKAHRYFDEGNIHIPASTEENTVHVKVLTNNSVEENMHTQGPIQHNTISGIIDDAIGTTIPIKTIANNSAEENVRIRPPLEDNITPGRRMFIDAEAAVENMHTQAPIELDAISDIPEEYKAITEPVEVVDDFFEKEREMDQLTTIKNEENVADLDAVKFNGQVAQTLPNNLENLITSEGVRTTVNYEEIGIDTYMKTKEEEEEHGLIKNNTEAKPKMLDNMPNEVSTTNYRESTDVQKIIENSIDSYVETSTRDKEIEVDHTRIEINISDIFNHSAEIITPNQKVENPSEELIEGGEAPNEMITISSIFNDQTKSTAMPEIINSFSGYISKEEPIIIAENLQETTDDHEMTRIKSPLSFDNMKTVADEITNHPVSYYDQMRTEKSSAHDDTLTHDQISSKESSSPAPTDDYLIEFDRQEAHRRFFSDYNSPDTSTTVDENLLSADEITDHSEGFDNQMPTERSSRDDVFTHYEIPFKERSSTASPDEDYLMELDQQEAHRRYFSNKNSSHSIDDMRTTVDENLFNGEEITVGYANPLPSENNSHDVIFIYDITSSKESSSIATTGGDYLMELDRQKAHRRLFPDQTSPLSIDDMSKAVHENLLSDDEITDHSEGYVNPLPTEKSYHEYILTHDQISFRESSSTATTDEDSLMELDRQEVHRRFFSDYNSPSLSNDDMSTTVNENLLSNDEKSDHSEDYDNQMPTESSSRNDLFTIYQIPSKERISTESTDEDYLMELDRQEAHRRFFSDTNSPSLAIDDIRTTVDENLFDGEEVTVGYANPPPSENSTHDDIFTYDTTSSKESSSTASTGGDYLMELDREKAHRRFFSDQTSPLLIDDMITTVDDNLFSDDKITDHSAGYDPLPTEKSSLDQIFTNYQIPSKESSSNTSTDEDYLMELDRHEAQRRYFSAQNSSPADDTRTTVDENLFDDKEITVAYDNPLPTEKSSEDQNSFLLAIEDMRTTVDDNLFSADEIADHSEASISPKNQMSIEKNSHDDIFTHDQITSKESSSTASTDEDYLMELDRQEANRRFFSDQNSPLPVDDMTTTVELNLFNGEEITVGYDNQMLTEKSSEVEINIGSLSNRSTDEDYLMEPDRDDAHRRFFLDQTSPPSIDDMTTTVGANLFGDEEITDNSEGYDHPLPTEKSSKYKIFTPYQIQSTESSSNKSTDDDYLMEPGQHEAHRRYFSVQNSPLPNDDMKTTVGTNFPNGEAITVGYDNQMQIEKSSKDDTKIESSTVTVDENVFSDDGITDHSAGYHNQIVTEKSSEDEIKGESISSTSTDEDYLIELDRHETNRRYFSDQSKGPLAIDDMTTTVDEHLLSPDAITDHSEGYDIQMPTEMSLPDDVFTHYEIPSKESSTTSTDEDYLMELDRQEGHRRFFSDQNSPPLDMRTTVDENLFNGDEITHHSIGYDNQMLTEKGMFAAKDDLEAINTNELSTSTLNYEGIIAYQPNRKGTSETDPDKISTELLKTEFDFGNIANQKDDIANMEGITKQSQIVHDDVRNIDINNPTINYSEMIDETITSKFDNMITFDDEMSQTTRHDDFEGYSTKSYNIMNSLNSKVDRRLTAAENRSETNASDYNNTLMDNGTMQDPNSTEKLVLENPSTMSTDEDYLMQYGHGAHRRYFSDHMGTVDEHLPSDGEITDHSIGYYNQMPTESAQDEIFTHDQIPSKGSLASDRPFKSEKGILTRDDMQAVTINEFYASTQTYEGTIAHQLHEYSNNPATINYKKIIDEKMANKPDKIVTSDDVIAHTTSHNVEEYTTKSFDIINSPSTKVDRRSSRHKIYRQIYEVRLPPTEIKSELSVSDYNINIHNNTNINNNTMQDQKSTTKLPLEKPSTTTSDEDYLRKAVAEGAHRRFFSDPLSDDTANYELPSNNLNTSRGSSTNRTQPQKFHEDGLYIDPGQGNESYGNFGEITSSTGGVEASSQSHNEEVLTPLALHPIVSVLDSKEFSTETTYMMSTMQFLKDQSADISREQLESTSPHNLPQTGDFMEPNNNNMGSQTTINPAINRNSSGDESSSTVISFAP